MFVVRAGVLDRPPGTRQQIRQNQCENAGEHSIQRKSKTPEDRFHR